MRRHSSQVIVSHQNHVGTRYPQETIGVGDERMLVAEVEKRTHPSAALVAWCECAQGAQRLRQSAFSTLKTDATRAVRLRGKARRLSDESSHLIGASGIES